MVRVGPFKLIRGDPGRPDGWIHPDKVINEEEEVLVEHQQERVQSNNSSDQVLLFHLDEDPYEKKNLAAEFPAITQYMGRLLDQYQVKTKEVSKCTWGSLLTFLDKVTWSANEFMLTNEKPPYKTKSSESSPIPM